MFFKEAFVIVPVFVHTDLGRLITGKFYLLELAVLDRTLVCGDNTKTGSRFRSVVDRNISEAQILHLPGDHVDHGFRSTRCAVLLSAKGDRILSAVALCLTDEGIDL